MRPHLFNAESVDLLNGQEDPFGESLYNFRAAYVPRRGEV
jgi:hypothetical protein